MKDENDYNVRVVDNALQILDCFDDQNPERGVSDIAQVVGLDEATTHRIVTSLQNYGYLERSEDGQRYHLGLKLAGLGFKVIRRMDLHREAQPFMIHIVETWDETCDLCVFDQERVFYVEVLRGNHSLSIAAAVGNSLPAHCTASGKIFLANLPESELNAFLSKPLQTYTKNTVTSPDILRQQLDLVRDQGYGFDDEELDAGIRAIAAPIRNHRGDLIAAMSIPGPVNRMKDERISQMTESLIKTAQKVSHRMGWKV